MTDGETAEFVVFVGASPGLNSAPVGAEQDYGRVSDFFERRKEEVAAEWETITQQIGDFLEQVTVGVNNFDLQEISFELGFSAEGHLGFIAATGVRASVRMTYRRQGPI